MADKAWMKIRRSVLDKAEYYRSIGKDKEWQKLETHVKAMDYGADGFGTPYKKLSNSELKKLMDANPEPVTLPKASLDMKRGAIDVTSGAPKKSLKIAERLRQNLKKVAESDAKALREMDDLLKEVAEITGSPPPKAIDVKATSKKLKKKAAVEKAGALVTQAPSTPVVKGGAIVPSPGGALSRFPGAGLPPGKSRTDILKQKLRIGAKRGLRSVNRAGRAIGAWDGTFTDRLTMGSNDPGYDKHGVKINDNTEVTSLRNPKDQKELDRARAFIKANPKFGKGTQKEKLARLDKAQAAISPMASTNIKGSSDDDWEGEVDDNRKDVLLDRKIDILRKDIARDPSIPFPKDKTPWYDDVTGLMKSRDQSIEQDEQEARGVINPEVIPTGSSAGQNAVPTPDGKKKRKKTRGKGPVKGGKGFGSAIPKKGKGGKSGLHNIAKNIGEARKALFGLFKVQKDRFKLRKSVDRKLATKLGAQQAEKGIEDEPDSPGSENKDDGRYKKGEKSDFEKKATTGILSALYVMAMPLMIKGLRPFFEEQADDIEKLQGNEEKDEDLKEDEQALDTAQKEVQKQEKEQKEQKDPPTKPPTQTPKKDSESPVKKPISKKGENIVPEAEVVSKYDKLIADGATIEDLGIIGGSRHYSVTFPTKEIRTGFLGLGKKKVRRRSIQGSTSDTSGSIQDVIEDTRIKGYREGGKLSYEDYKKTDRYKSRQARITNLKNDPTATRTTNKKSGLKQISAKDLGPTGEKSLNKFVKPIKSVFQLPSIVLKKTFGIGKKALGSTAKLAGAALKMSPFGMAVSIAKGLRGKPGREGRDGSSWERYKQSDRYKNRQARIEALRNDPTATRTMTVNGKQVAPQAMDSMLALKNKRVNKLRAKRDFANPLGGLMKDAKERGVGGILGGVADALTGNAFDFDGKNVKSAANKKDKGIDKGDSPTDKIVKVMSKLNSVSNTISIAKAKTGGTKMKTKTKAGSKMSQSAIDAALQPGL